jgi:hypothetical protein
MILKYNQYNLIQEKTTLDKLKVNKHFTEYLIDKHKKLSHNFKYKLLIKSQTLNDIVEEIQNEYGFKYLLLNDKYNIFIEIYANSTLNLLIYNFRYNNIKNIDIKYKDILSYFNDSFTDMCFNIYQLSNIERKKRQKINWYEMFDFYIPILRKILNNYYYVVKEYIKKITLEDHDNDYYTGLISILSTDLQTITKELKYPFFNWINDHYNDYDTIPENYNEAVKDTKLYINRYLEYLNNELYFKKQDISKKLIEKNSTLYKELKDDIFDKEIQQQFKHLKDSENFDLI